MKTYTKADLASGAVNLHGVILTTSPRLQHAIVAVVNRWYDI